MKKRARTKIIPQAHVRQFKQSGHVAHALFDLDPNKFNIHRKKVSLVLFGTKHRKLGESKLGPYLKLIQSNNTCTSQQSATTAYGVASIGQGRLYAETTLATSRTTVPSGTSCNAFNRSETGFKKDK
jgi:hypothetical protein